MPSRKQHRYLPKKMDVKMHVQLFRLISIMSVCVATFACSQSDSPAAALSPTPATTLPSAPKSDATTITPDALAAVAECDRLAAHPADAAKPTDVEGVEFDDVDGVSAIAACEKAIALSPSPRMYYQLGRAMEVNSDPIGARKPLQKAVDAKYARAFGQMGSTFDTDESDNPDGAVAFKWYLQGAELNDGTSAFNVATCLYRGHCAEENIVEALKWYKKSAALGYPEAQDWVDVLTEEIAEQQN
jgi:hypothetical protein